VLGLGWGAAGVALGTAIAQWLSCALLFVYVRQSYMARWHRALRLRGPGIWELAGLRRLVAVNRDIFVRTLFLLASFAWFTNQGARFGDVTLSANHILLQFV